MGSAINPQPRQEKWEDFAPLFELPSTYKKMESSIVNTIHKIGYLLSCESYAMEKDTHFPNREIPRMIKENNIDESFVLDRVARIRHAMYFKKLADDSPAESKPILYYYSLEQLMSFFISSVFEFDNKQANHGISVQYKQNPYDTTVVLEERGFFARTVDTYSIFVQNSIFSVLLYRNIPYFRAPDYSLNHHALALTKKVSVSLRELLALDLSQDVVSNDLRTMILIYVGSHIARYRPFLWNKIVAGIDNDLILSFNKAYDTYEYIVRKTIVTLNSLRYGGNANSLRNPSGPPMSEVFTFYSVV